MLSSRTGMIEAAGGTEDALRVTHNRIEAAIGKKITNAELEYIYHNWRAFFKDPQKYWEVGEQVVVDLTANRFDI